MSVELTAYAEISVRCARARSHSSSCKGAGKTTVVWPAMEKSVTDPHVTGAKVVFSNYCVGTFSAVAYLGHVLPSDGPRETVASFSAGFCVNANAH